MRYRRSRAGTTYCQHTCQARRGIERGKRSHVVARIGQIDEMTSGRYGCSSQHRLLALKRAGCIYHDAGTCGTQLLRRDTLAIEY
jgi:hypothetical protein